MQGNSPSKEEVQSTAQLEHQLNHVPFKTFTVKSLVSDDFKISLPELTYLIEFIKKDLTSAFNQSQLSIIFECSESSDDNNIINLSNFTTIKDFLSLKAFFAVLGSVNSKNDFTQYTSDYYSSIEVSHFIENNASYMSYLMKNLPVIFSEYKMRDFSSLIEALKEIGLCFKQYLPVYEAIRNEIYVNSKILVLIVPSNNFWIKVPSETPIINGVNYDKKLNMSANIFYNWDFVKRFYDRIANHPRCQLGFLSSAMQKNLRHCIDFMQVNVKNFKTDYLILDQTCHEVSEKNAQDQPIKFVRNFEKLKTMAANLGSFDDTNIVILEAEPEKSKNIKANILEMIAMPSNFFDISSEDRLQLQAKNEKLLDYLVKMLDECQEDVREYLAVNTI